MVNITTTYPGRCVLALDQALNVWTLDGAVGETISHHAAVASQSGKRWACILCRWLSWTVETNHCPKVLAGEATSTVAGLKAGVQLLVVGTVIAAGYLWGIDLAVTLLRRLRHVV